MEWMYGHWYIVIPVAIVALVIGVLLPGKK